MPKMYLFLGVLLFFLALISNYIYFNSFGINENGELNGPFIDQLKKFPPLLLLVFPLIISPIMEEFAFRGWLKSTGIRKIITICFVVLYIQSAFHSVLFSLLILSTLILFQFRIKKNALAVNVIFTSILFSVVHIQNFNDPFIAFSGLTQLFGVGLILSYVTYRFGIVYSIILHAVNNTIAFLPLILVGNSDQVILFEGETYLATLTPVSIFEFRTTNIYDDNDAISITNNIEEIAVELAPFETDMIYKSSSVNLANYSLKVYPKSNKSIDPNTLFNDYLNINAMNCDTIQTTAYTLEQVPDFVYQGSNEPTYKTTLFNLIRQIRNKYSIPLWIPKHLNDAVLTIDISTINMSLLDDFRCYLELKQGIRILDPDQIQLKEVRFQRK